MTPLGSLIHDSNSALGDIDWQIKEINKFLKDHGKAIGESGINTSPVYIALEYLKTDKKKIQDAQDKYYIWAKENGQTLF